jgi:hypothetical protein
MAGTKTPEDAALETLVQALVAAVQNYLTIRLPIENNKGDPN